MVPVCILQQHSTSSHACAPQSPPLQCARSQPRPCPSPQGLWALLPSPSRGSQRRRWLGAAAAYLSSPDLLLAKLLQWRDQHLAGVLNLQAKTDTNHPPPFAQLNPRHQPLNSLSHGNPPASHGNPHASPPSALRWLRPGGGGGACTKPAPHRSQPYQHQCWPSSNSKTPLLMLFECAPPTKFTLPSLCSRLQLCPGQGKGHQGLRHAAVPPAPRHPP